MLLSKSLLEKGISLTEVLDSIEDGMIIVDSDGQFIYWNQSASVFIQNPTVRQNNPEGVREYGLFSLDKKSKISQDRIPLMRALKGESFFDYRIFIRNQQLENGMFISCNGRPILEDDRLVGAIVTFRDISGVLATEAKINSDKDFYVKIMNYIPAIVFSKDLSGKYLFTNKSFEKFVSSSKSSIGKTIYDFFDHESATKIKNHDEQVIKTGKPEEFHEEFLGEDGPHYFKSVRFPIFDDQKKILAIGGIGWDITQDLTNERMLEQERQKSALTSKLAALGMLSAEIAHEINNPLSIINTSTRILKIMLEDKETPIKDLLETVGVIEQTVQRITGIVSALKNSSRDSSSELMGQYKISEIIGEVVTLAEVKIKSKGLKIVIETSPEINAIKLNCFRTQLSEVFINLISNAIDAVEDQTEPWIKIAISEDTKNIYFKVMDSGAGVPTSIRDRIFDSFYTTKLIGKGTGLGLSICKNIMQKHSGDIYLDPQSSSCFVVVLPKHSNV